MSTLTLGIIVIIYMFVIAWLGYLGGNGQFYMEW